MTEELKETVVHYYEAIKKDEGFVTPKGLVIKLIREGFASERLMLVSNWSRKRVKLENILQ